MVDDKLVHAKRPDLTEGKSWSVVIEPLDGASLFPYRVYLSRGVLIWGSDSWGWMCHSLKSAQRKGAKELARRNRAEAKLNERRKEIEASHD